MTGIKTIAQKHVHTIISYNHFIIHFIFFGDNEEYWNYLANDTNKYFP